jgi:hypothetical protein
MTPDWRAGPDELALGLVLISFQRTRQLEDHEPSASSSSYGALPMARAASSDAAAPSVIVPIGDDEAFWLGLETVDEDEPGAVRVLIETPTTIDALTGGAPGEALTDDPQNYVVVPLQRSLEGVRAGQSTARQFVRVARSLVAAPCEVMRFVVFRLRPGIAPAPRPPAPHGRLHAGSQESSHPEPESPEQNECGHALQRIEPDPYGPDAWQPDAPFTVRVRLVSPAEYTALTGQVAPDRLNPSEIYHGWRLP